MTEFIQYFTHSEEVRLLTFITISTIITTSMLIYRWGGLVKWMVTHRSKWTHARVDHVQLGLVYTAYILSAGFWVGYHPLLRGYEFLDADYISHIYGDLVEQGLMWSVLFLNITTLMLFSHIKIKKELE